MSEIVEVPVNILRTGIGTQKRKLNTDKVKEYAREEDIPILMEIPFDRHIAEIYSQGKLLIEELPNWREKFIHLYEDVVDHARKG